MGKLRRNSPFELLRIISMMMILGLHYLNKNIGGGLRTENQLNQYLAVGLESICITSVNCFVLISGYYMIYEKQVRLIKILDLLLMMVVYGFVFYWIAVLTGEKTFALEKMAITVVPFLAGERWFLRTYIILMFLAPFVNRLIEGIGKKQLLALVVIQLLFFSVWPSFLPKPPITDKGYGIINFLTLYFIAAYIRKYYMPKTDRWSRAISGFIFFASVTVIILTALVPKLSERKWNYNYLFNITGSVALFCFFLNIKPFTNHLINQIAKLTFGVYLSHTILQKLVYHRIMNIAYYRETVWFVPHFVLCVVAQFCVFAFIDYLRLTVWPYTAGRISGCRIAKNIEKKINEYVDPETVAEPKKEI